MHNPIDTLLAAYAAAVLAKDADAFAALYTDDVTVFDAWDRWAYRGLAAWRGMAQAWFGSLGDEGVRVSFSEVHAEGDADIAFGHAVVEYAAVNAEGQRLRAQKNRISLVARNSGGRWQIAHEHTSLPLDFATKVPLPPA